VLGVFAASVGLRKCLAEAGDEVAGDGGVTSMLYGHVWVRDNGFLVLTARAEVLGGLVLDDDGVR
jgi:hypothetical protein